MIKIRIRTSQEEVELRILAGLYLSLRFNVGRWVHLGVTKDELVRLLADERLEVERI